MTNKFRLDKFLVDQKLVETRNKAQYLIKNNMIKINGQIIDKSNYLVTLNDKIEIISQLKFVSRAGEKLEFAIQNFKINLENKIVLDIGASTGGFTDCCLKYDAKKVYALDVGTDQLHHTLVANPKVINLANTNLKKIPDIFKNIEIDIIVVDVSFISLKIVFETIKHIFLDQNILICLIKPQFELDKQIMSKNKGSVKLKIHHDIAIKKVLNYAKENNFNLLNIIESPILGAKGENKEFLAVFKKF